MRPLNPALPRAALRRARHLCALALLGTAGSAPAQEAPAASSPPAHESPGESPASSAPTTGEPPPEASTADAGEPPSGHRLTVYSHVGARLYLSDVRTTGGLGGGVGLRDTLQERFILQADLGYLTLIGNVMALRLGAGLQRSGTYTPAVLLNLSTLLGDRLTFLSPEHPRPTRLPVLALGVSVAPLRFTANGTQLSVLELGVGLAPELPGMGVSWHLGLLEVGITL